MCRQTQWDPPNWDSPEDDASLEHEAEMDLGTPTYDENPMKVSWSEAPPDRRCADFLIRGVPKLQPAGLGPSVRTHSGPGIGNLRPRFEVTMHKNGEIGDDGDFFFL